MVVAGNETTTKLLGNAIYWGGRNPDQLAKVFAAPERVTDWVEETLCYDTSSQIVARTVAEDLEWHGQAIPAGDRMLLLPGSANRDERAFPDPDVYDLDRDRSPQSMSFGGGTHFCLGAHLARLEARIVLTELIGRVTGYEVDEASAERVHSTNVRGFGALPVRMEVS